MVFEPINAPKSEVYLSGFQSFTVILSLDFGGSQAYLEFEEHEHDD